MISLSLFPADFPFELQTSAFTSGNDAAWPRPLAAEVVEWLGAHGYAVLGTELWVVNGEKILSLPLGTSGLPEVHGNTTNRRQGELWSEFIARAAAETARYLRQFRPEEIRSPGEIRFNVVWSDEGTFDRLADGLE
jgi:hypothetical protein